MYTHCHSDEGDRGRWSWQTGGSHWSCLHGQQLLLSTQVTFLFSPSLSLSLSLFSLPPSVSSIIYTLVEMCQLLLQERWSSCSGWITKGFYFSGKGFTILGTCVKIFYLACVLHCLLIEQQPSYSVPVSQKIRVAFCARVLL